MPEAQPLLPGATKEQLDAMTRSLHSQAGGSATQCGSGQETAKQLAGLQAGGRKSLKQPPAVFYKGSALCGKTVTFSIQKCGLQKVEEEEEEEEVEETSPLQLRDKVEHVLGANGLFVLVTRVKMFRLPNGKTAATISMESGARLDVLECWGNLAKSGSLAQFDTTLRLREDLTKAGRLRQQELNPLYDELKGKGLKPRWRNGAELFYQPNSSAKPQPYVHTTPPPPPSPPAYASSGSAQQHQQQQQQQQQTSDTSTPQRDTHKRPTEETGTGLRQQKAKSAGGTKAGGTSGAAGAAGTSSGSKAAPAKTSG
ncbi:hypothetical protein HXX76_009431 [Chlamydomonas incerta]|uniref:Uncharacterized protein n=1 Tax=Chlamydomonas incerta TaxID=51695 RepID=A0A835ST72_CHLIN|nr:hypothetical protein HXX76_009431 [Chlamydomonas incerta]|eukprot:KAG2431416.1 hypothetical protein HXX76_009431 [Chlamydomonas incerta]